MDDYYQPVGKPVEQPRPGKERAYLYALVTAGVVIVGLSLALGFSSGGSSKRAASPPKPTAAQAAQQNTASRNAQVAGLSQEVAVLTNQEKTLQARIANLQRQGTGSEGASSQRDSTLLAALQTELVGDGTTIDNYNAQIAAINANAS